MKCMLEANACDKEVKSDDLDEDLVKAERVPVEEDDEEGT
jgi:hypothetical protein